MVEGFFNWHGERVLVRGELGDSPRCFEVANGGGMCDLECPNCRGGLDVSEDNSEPATIVGTVKRPFLECAHCGRRMKIVST